MILHIFVFLVSHSNEYPLGFNREGKKDKQKTPTGKKSERINIERLCLSFFPFHSLSLSLYLSIYLSIYLFVILGLSVTLSP
jgi:hypothetical protein